MRGNEKAEKTERQTEKRGVNQLLAAADRKRKIKEGLSVQTERFEYGSIIF